MLSMTVWDLIAFFKKIVQFFWKVVWQMFYKYLCPQEAYNCLSRIFFLEK